MDYRWIKAEQAAFADKVIEVKNNQGPWAAIDVMVDYWRKTNPEEYRSFVIDVEGERKKRDRAARTSRKDSANWRYTLDIPSQIWQMISVIFGDKEQIDPFDKEFFRKFAKRYPEFTVSQQS